MGDDRDGCTRRIPHRQMAATPLPSSAASFSFAGLGIAWKYASEPEVAIRNGDFFNCIQGAGEPLLFDFLASAGTLKFSSGSAAADRASLHVAVRAENQPVRLVLLRDGVIARQVQADRLDVLRTEAGVYGVEDFPRPLPNSMKATRPRNDSSAAESEHRSFW
jgi:hypothetical protein